MKKETKYPLVVTVTPHPEPDHENLAGIEAKVNFTEGEAVFHFVPPGLMEKDFAAGIAKALEEKNLREIKFDSEMAGRVWFMWKGASCEVGFWVTVQGPEYLSRRAKDALRERKANSV